MNKVKDRAPQWAIQIVKAARQRAKVRGHDCTITPELVAEMAERSRHRCELTGIPFDFSEVRREMEARRPFFPSLDRFDNAIGYVPGNVRLVCVAANYAMNAWGEEVFRMIAKGLLGVLAVADVKHARNRSARTVKGVKYIGANRAKPFEARIGYRGKCISLGTFASENDAQFAYMVAKQRKENGLDPRGDNGVVCEAGGSVAGQGKA